MINICIPTLNAYGELMRCIDSISASTVKVDNIVVLDNGGKFFRNFPSNLRIVAMPRNVGVAKSWNWFISNVPETRIICNDDVEFAPDAIERMINSYDENNLIFPTGLESINAFSCFLLPQNIINSVGLFDEKISPDYAYYEDNDYHRRMRLAGFDIKTCDAGVRHLGSSTMKNYGKIMRNEHHKKFKLAKANYIKKWGGEPGQETFGTPYGS
jgi:GT2 family glycosyltransferase